MTLGRGYGVPFGGGPLVPTQEPATDVGDLPTEINFADEPDGKFPATWEFIQRFTTGGIVSGAADPSPSPIYYLVNSGLARFNYTQQPFTGDNSERGYIAGPTGIIVGANCEMTAVFVAPPTLLDLSQDSFTFDFILAVRANDDFSSFVGARVRAAWDNVSGWTTPVAVEAVQQTPSGLVVLGSATFDPSAFRALIDVWTLPMAQLRVNVVGDTLLAELNGVWQALATVEDTNSAKVGLLVKAFHQRGAARTAPGTISAVQFRTLRDLARLGPGDPIAGNLLMDAPPTTDQFLLPLTDLVAKGFLKRRGGRQWIATQDFQVEVDQFSDGLHTLTTGSIVTAVEPFAGQDLVPCVVDFITLRARRAEGGN